MENNCTASSAFSAGCKKAGIALIIIFAVRIINDTVSYFLAKLLAQSDPTLSFYLRNAASLLILYGGGIIVTAAALKIKLDRSLYKKPRKMGKAVSWVLPAYGAGQLINLTVTAISFLLLKNSQALFETYKPITSNEQSVILGAALFTFIELVVFAPIFEELWFRGVIERSLLPYGNGFAIVVSALCFGFAHGNLHQFCYTFVMGLLIGYVYYATGSILPTTIIHAMLNGISGIMILLISTPDISDAVSNVMQGLPLTEAQETAIKMIGLYFLFIVLIIIIGISCSISKLKNRRLYVPVNNNPSLTKSQKAAKLISSPVFLTGALLCIAYIVLQLILGILW